MLTSVGLNVDTMQNVCTNARPVHSGLYACGGAVVSTAADVARARAASASRCARRPLASMTMRTCSRSSSNLCQHMYHEPMETPTNEPIAQFMATSGPPLIPRREPKPTALATPAIRLFRAQGILLIGGLLLYQSMMLPSLGGCDGVSDAGGRRCWGTC